MLSGCDLTLLECLVEVVELRKNEFAIVVVLGACVLRLRICARMAAAPPPARMAALAVLLPADQCSCIAAGGPRAGA